MALQDDGGLQLWSRRESSVRSATRAAAVRTPENYMSELLSALRLTA
jgi:hypothetical protein